MNRSFLFTACALLSSLVGGCGSLAENTDQHEPLAVLQGELTNPEAMSTSSAVRVAVIWNCGSMDLDMYRVSQEVEVEPVFPSRFRLELTEPPPADCMLDPYAESEDYDEGPSGAGGPGDPDVPAPGPAPAPSNTPQDIATAGSTLRVGVGTIAAYDDLNGNGKLDLVDPTASAYIDAVLGTNESLILVYVEGSAAGWDDAKDTNGNFPASGYNLLQFSDSVYPEDDDVAVPGDHAGAGGAPVDGVQDPSDGTEEPVPMPESEESVPTMQWLAPDTFFVLTMTADAQFSEMMCRVGGFASESSGSAGAPVTNPGEPVPVPEQYPSPDDPELYCMTDGQSYYYQTCVQEGVCTGKFCTSEYWRVPDAANPPADWPCPIE